MPRIKFIFSILLFFLFSGCFDQKKQIKHGLSTIPVSQFTYRGVVERTIKLTFSVDKGETSKIIARIETEYDYNYPLRFQWKLGQHIQLVNGSQLQGEIAQMRKNAPLEFEIAVTGFNSETPRFIKFEVIGSNPQKRIFADGLVSSKPEKSFEKIVQEIETYKKENQ